MEIWRQLPWCQNLRLRKLRSCGNTQLVNKVLFIETTLNWETLVIFYAYRCSGNRFPFILLCIRNAAGTHAHAELKWCLAVAFFVRARARAILSVLAPLPKHHLPFDVVTWAVAFPSQKPLQNGLILAHCPQVTHYHDPYPALPLFSFVPPNSHRAWIKGSACHHWKTLSCSWNYTHHPRRGNQSRGPGPATPSLKLHRWDPLPSL